MLLCEGISILQNLSFSGDTHHRNPIAEVATNVIIALADNTDSDDESTDPAEAIEPVQQNHSLKRPVAAVNSKKSQSTTKYFLTQTIDWREY